MIRFFDIIISILIILCIAPVYFLLFIMVYFDLNENPIFIQKRNGKNKKKFNFYKFRTMKVAEDGEVNFVQATSNDSRITRFGQILRTFSLDELPQFFNVLIGDMSIVGPRPHPIALDEKFEYLPNYNSRYLVKPGITGLAQIKGFTGETDTTEKMLNRLNADLEYIEKQSLRLYLFIFFRTAFGKFYQK